VVARYATHGLEPIVGPELEWFLCTRDPTAPNGLGRYVDELSRVYTVGAVSDPRQINLKTLLWADELGLEAFAGNHEFMNSQYEINLKHSSALDAADRAFMLKAAVKEVAAIEGLLATFMGRPFTDQGGSGFHVHLSVADAAGRTRSRPTGRSWPARPSHFVGRPRARAGAGALPARRSTRTSDPPRQPAPTHANWGRQPHRVLSVPNERLADVRDPHRRRLRPART
jgi:glutamine synthetase